VSGKRRTCDANIHESVSHSFTLDHLLRCTSRSLSRVQGPIWLCRGWDIFGFYSRLDLVEDDRILDFLAIIRVLTF